MSKLFWDGIVEFEEIKAVISQTGSLSEEREELDMLVDATVTPKVLESILDQLPKEHHKGFLELFGDIPYDKETIFGFISEKKGINTEEVEEMLRGKLNEIKENILQELRPQDEISVETRTESKPPVK